VPEKAFDTGDAAPRYFSLPLWVGLKSVHRFLFRNWQRMREA
jgi:hypothetical protein